jgi:hypothetical protein
MIAPPSIRPPPAPSPRAAATTTRRPGLDVGGTIHVLRGNGDGTFLRADPYAALPSGGTLVAGDVDGDGNPDLLLITPDMRVAPLLGDGDGTFAPAQPVGDTLAGSAIAAADLDGNGHLDLVVAHAGEATSAVLLGAGDGTLRSAGAVPASGALHVADVDGDGVLDLVVESGGVTVFRGHGDGTFEPAGPAGSFPIAGADLGLADLDGDGLPEIVTVPGSLGDVTVFRNATLRGPAAPTAQ